MQPLLVVDRLKTVYLNGGKEIRVLDDINFALDAGETLCIVGESGCGKSVTALSIMGLQGRTGRIRSGRVLLDGTNLAGLNEKEWREIRGNKLAMIFQEPLTSLNPVFTVGFQMGEVLKLHLKMNKQEARKFAIEMLNKAGIMNAERVIDAYPHALSGGMRQRVMIAMALSCSPRLLIADEPTTALDVTVQAQILELIRKLQQKMGMSVMLITHDLGVVAEMADKVIVMYAGQVVEEAEVNALFDNPLHPYTQGLMQLIPGLDAGVRLEPIKGSVPVGYEDIRGCRFLNRCPFAAERCQAESPPLRRIGDHHRVRCWLYEERAEGGGREWA